MCGTHPCCDKLAKTCVYFQLVLPYGTVVIVVVDKWPTHHPVNFMNIYIQPSTNDIGRASGMFKLVQAIILFDLYL